MTSHIRTLFPSGLQGYECFIRKPTIPKFKSSYSSGRSEYSLVEPYKLMKHGPNKGRNPARKKKAESQEKVRRYRRFLHVTHVNWPRLAV